MGMERGRRSRISTDGDAGGGREKGARVYRVYPFFQFISKS